VEPPAAMLPFLGSSVGLSPPEDEPDEPVFPCGEADEPALPGDALGEGLGLRDLEEQPIRQNKVKHTARMRQLVLFMTHFFSQP